MTSEPTTRGRLSEADALALERFAKLVKTMRAVQTRYFRGDRSRECLALSRDLEARVDRAIVWLLGDQSSQGAFDFPPEPPGVKGKKGGDL